MVQTNTLLKTGSDLASARGARERCSVVVPVGMIAFVMFVDASYAELRGTQTGQLGWCSCRTKLSVATKAFRFDTNILTLPSPPRHVVLLKIFPVHCIKFLLLFLDTSLIPPNSGSFLALFVFPLRLLLAVGGWHTKLKLFSITRHRSTSSHFSTREYLLDILSLCHIINTFVNRGLLLPYPGNLTLYEKIRISAPGTYRLAYFLPKNESFANRITVLPCNHCSCAFLNQGLGLEYGGLQNVYSPHSVVRPSLCFVESKEGFKGQGS